MRGNHRVPDLSPARLVSRSELHRTIRWLVKLRWVAIGGVILVVAASAHLLHLVTRWLPLYGIAAGMVAYNTAYYLLGRNPSRPHLLALSQIILDLVALTALLHYAGGIGNPFACFFVFHVILASILLSEGESYAVATLACGLFIGLVLAESLGALPYHALDGALIQQDIGIFSGLNPGVLIAFVIMIYSAAYLTGTVATQLRQRETQVRYLLAYNQGLIDHLGEEISVIGPDYHLHFTNDLVQRKIAGRDTPTCYTALWGEEAPCQGCPIDQVVDEGASFTLRRKGEDERVYEQIFTPLTTPEGTCMIIEKCRDITGQVEIQQQLALSEKMAVIGELAAGLAHDIGNPLDGCQHALDLVRRRIPTTLPVHTFLALMEQGLRRIDMIVRRFLVLARQDGIDKRPTNICEVIDNALLFLEHRIAEHDITVEKDCPSLLPSIRVDPDALCQALTNVLLNAAEAIEGPGRIGITVRHTDQGDHGWLEVRISDTGCGIPEHTLQRIFDPFFTTKPAGKGTGLGLAITKRLIHSHGGEVCVISSMGAGSTFVIGLPVGEQPIAEQNKEKPDGERHPALS